MAEGMAQASGDEKGTNLWSLLPSFDPSLDNAKEYADKVRFLWGICPMKDKTMLAPRLALLCKGTAWSQVKGLASEKLTDPDNGYKVLLKALETWEESAELQTYEAFERAFYKTVQKPDETAVSYVNRINVAFQEVGSETTVQTVKAFVILRQSGLNAEDKKRIISMAGSYDPSKIEDSMVQVCQDSPELSMAFSAYQEARAKIRDKVRGRGFWPIRSFPKGKGKTKKGKNFFKKRQSLSERIASSNCRICGVRGHWKEECPQKDRQGGAEANMLTTVEEQLIGEILEDLPLDNMTTWEARQQGHTRIHPGVPPVYSDVNDEFVCMVVPGTSKVLHVNNIPNEKFRFRSVLKRALETSFGVVRSRKNETESSADLGPSGTGIIDTGASKSVIGEKRVSDLLATLKHEHQSLVKWQKSETVFRFGNNGTLKSLGALYIPFGSKWLRIEVVQGWTPFLISNAFLSAVGADLLISHSVLRVSAWDKDVSLCRNSKGLFTIKLTELIEAACKFDQRPKTEEVITMASSSNNIPSRSKGVYCTQQQQQPWSNEMDDVNGMSAAKVAQPQFNSDNVISSDAPHGDVPVNHGVHAGEEQQQPCRVPGDGGLCKQSGRESGCSIDGTSRSRFELQPAADHQELPSRRDLNTSGVGRHEVPGRQVEECHLCRRLSPGPEVRALHGQPHQAGVPMGIELQELCQCSAESSDRARRAEEEDGAGNGEEGARGADDRLVGNVPPKQCGLGGDLTDGAVWWSQSTDQSSQEVHGGRDRWQPDEARICPGEQDRQDHPNGSASARAGSSEGGSRSVENTNVPEIKALKLETASVDSICQQLEYAQVSIEKDLAKLQATWTRPSTIKAEKPSWGLDLLEIYCEPDSQLTEQARRLGLRAERFTIHDGDLSTTAGREALWKKIMEKCPSEIWMAPECKYWGNFSRRNMGRSISTAAKIQAGRDSQRVHLKLCNEVYWHQMSVGGHFHLEQPQGSEAIEQPELRDVKEGILCTTFDMCEVGKLLAPRIQRKISGNNFMRKRTTVFTSSKVFHKAFDHRLCVGNHEHVPIEGKVLHLGRWISLSEYAARYSSGFGRNVARYLACQCWNSPLLWEELSVGHEDVEFVAAVINRKREKENI